jgi:hypothetical protein
MKKPSEVRLPDNAWNESPETQTLACLDPPQNQSLTSGAAMRKE